MPSENPTPFDDRTRPTEDAADKLPQDPGKTWVPQERDSPIQGQTEVFAAPPEETQPIAGKPFDPSSEPRATAPPAEECDEPPQRFGGYELLEKIGRGGMGMVFKARDCRLDRIVALKTLKVRSTKTEQQVERFVREAKAAARLDHPNIIPCYDSGEHDGWHYLTMAYVAGKSLQDRLEQGPMPPEDAARLVHALAGAVAHAHHQGVIHRDIKPSNVLLDKDDRPRLTDFGIAKLLDGDLFSAPAQITLVGQVLGTPGYMAPEQSAGRRWEIGESVDIYALGKVLSAALTGQRPGAADTLPLDLPAELQAICNRCLAHRPQDRYSSADDVVEALEEFLKGPTRPAAPATPPSKEDTLADEDPVFTISKTGLKKTIALVVVVLVSAVLLATWLAGLWGKSGSSENKSNNAGQSIHSLGTNPASLAESGDRIRFRLAVFVNRNGVSIPLESFKTLPLKPGEDIEVDVRADRLERVSLYLVRIGTTGKATLENGGRPIRLSPPVATVDSDLPKLDFAPKSVATEFLAIDRKGPSGVLTLMLLSRKEPLPDDFREELDRAFGLLTIKDAEVALGAVDRFAYDVPQSLSVPARMDLEPFIARHRESDAISTMTLVEALFPFFDRFEGVQFHVPEQFDPARAERAPARSAQQ